MANKDVYILTMIKLYLTAVVFTFAAALASGEGIDCGARRPCVCVSAEPRLYAVGGEGNVLCSS